ncbi:MAG TPA: DUF748 domain-containing protein [Steroidobacteraceae bacterium]|nr:DUF748 domain-containing protein [Steroidobacteraceae bacterium]
MLQLLRTRIARLTIVLAAIVGLYALAGFVIAPRIARNALLEDIPKTLDATPAVGEIHVNPFLFQVDVRDFALADKSGEKLLGFGRLFVDFQLSSIWHRAYTFKQIEIDAPYVNAVVARDGTLNLLALRPRPQAPTPAAKPGGPLPALRVGSFRISQGALSYEDRSRPSQFAAHLEPVNFELDDFVTGAQGGLFTFSGTSKLGERVEWQGRLSVQPIASEGELRIDGLRARTLWEYLQDRLNFVIGSGTLDLQSTYRFTLKDTVELEMNVANASVTDLTVSPRGSAAEWVRVPKLSVTGMNVDLGERLAQIESVSCSGLKLDTWLQPDGSLNLLDLVAPRSSVAAAGAPRPTAPSTAGPTAGNASATAGNAAPPTPWRAELKQIDLTEASISAEDRRMQPVAKVVLAPLSLRIGGASLDLGKPVDVRLDTHINGGGSLEMSGAVTPQPASASLKLRLAGIDLALAQPYIAERTSVTLRNGKLGGEGQLRFDAAALQAAGSTEHGNSKAHGHSRGHADSKRPAALSFAGDIQVEDLHTVDNFRHQDLIRWKRLDIRGLRYQQSPDRLDIAEIMVRRPYARVIIESDATLNVKNALKGPGDKRGAESGAATAPAARPDSAKPGEARAVETTKSAAQSGSASMPMAIRTVRIEDGLANFTDHSVAPTFSAAIQHLEGSVRGLSSKPGSRATVDLKGAVGAYSPVSIKGRVNLLSASLYTDLVMDFRDIELSIFNPYSGKFAGYDISKGKLTTDLHYKIDAGKLDAQHHIVIDQLEFGAKTNSKEAVSLPIKLAVALLKDRNGVIDLELPVTGSLKDPQFRLGPIIWKVFVNILEKAVTAPFALLGSLFGGGPDLQYIDFRPGASALDETQENKVKAIVKALQQRPQLNIEVPIAAVPDVDRPALVDAELNARLREAMLQTPKHKKQAAVADTPSFDQLDADSKLELLTRVYEHELGAAPRYPDSVTAGKPKADQTSAKIAFLMDALRKHLTVTDDSVRTLAEQRAQALQKALLDGTQIDPKRVFLVANNKAAAKDGEVRLQLSLR